MPARPQPAWPLIALTLALGSEPVPLADPVHGVGVGLHLGTPPHDLRLALYPAAQLVQLRTPTLALDLRHAAPPHIGAALVSFHAPLSPDRPQAEAYRLIVKATGHCFFTYAPGLLGLTHDPTAAPRPQTTQDAPGAPLPGENREKQLFAAARRVQRPCSGRATRQCWPAPTTPAPTSSCRCCTVTGDNQRRGAADERLLALHPLPRGDA